MMSTLRPQMP